MLHLKDVLFRIEGRTLLDGATAHVPAGARVGLVGRNGTGKSTLLKLIVGDWHVDGGDVLVRPRARVGRLAQEAPDGDMALVDCVLAADTERAALLAELDGHPEAGRMADIHERLNAIDAHAAPARAAAILAGLGFPAADQGRAVREYSGGWRMRVALAAVLFARPDLLLLDEPTNHLDLEATLWLQGHLAGYPGTLIIVSHDRDLLNAVPNRILHLDGGKLTLYSGNYDAFERIRRETMDLQAKAYAKQMEQRRRIEGFVERFRAKATKARQAQSRLKMLERMEPVVAVIEDRPVVLEFPDPDPLPPPLLQAEAVAVGYGGRAVLRDVSFRMDMDDRIALLGANGNGKSTLAKLITGRLTAMEGALRKSPKLRVGYFAQHQQEELDPADTPLGHMGRAMAKGGAMPPDSKVRAHLGRFGFGVDHATTRVEALSGGEKARLLIALMCKEEPHLIVLDEPTNHLDIDTREALVAALNAFEGAVVLISHDVHLVEMVADRLWLVADGGVRPFDGDMADYRAYLLQEAREARRAPAAPAAAAAPAAGRKEDRRAAAEARKRLAPLKKAVEAAEKAVETLTARKTALETRMAEPALYDGPADRLTALQRDLGETAKALDEAEAAWMEALETYEAARAADESGGG
jgi:ATP-binding cassette subfamily F protein 3